MVQTTGLKTLKSITFLLPDVLAAWPYMQRLHPDYDTVNVESTNWVIGYNLFSEKAQKSFDKCRFGQWQHNRSLYPEVYYFTSGLLGCLVFSRATRGIRRAWFYTMTSDGSKLSVVRVVILRMSILSSTSTLMSLSLVLRPAFVT